MARPLEMKVSFTDETNEKIDSLKTEVQLREDVDLVMRSLALLIAPGDVKDAPPSVDEAREFLKVLTDGEFTYEDLRAAHRKVGV